MDWYGIGIGGVFCFSIIVVVMYMCCMSSIISNLRLDYFLYIE